VVHCYVNDDTKKGERRGRRNRKVKRERSKERRESWEIKVIGERDKQTDKKRE
jgi:hypothetical protein